VHERVVNLVGPGVPDDDHDHGHADGRAHLPERRVHRGGAGVPTPRRERGRDVAHQREHHADADREHECGGKVAEDVGLPLRNVAPTDK
jgi:hypothetical protein